MSLRLGKPDGLDRGPHGTSCQCLLIWATSKEWLPCVSLCRKMRCIQMKRNVPPLFSSAFGAQNSPCCATAASVSLCGQDGRPVRHSGAAGTEKAWTFLKSHKSPAPQGKASFCSSLDVESSAPSHAVQYLAPDAPALPSSYLDFNDADDTEWYI